MRRRANSSAGKQELTRRRHAERLQPIQIVDDTDLKDAKAHPQTALDQFLVDSGVPDAARI
jgi:hypothetical protein